MKKSKLIIDYNYDFHLFGISSSVREYKLAWSINRALDINLAKAEDIKIEFSYDKHLVISNYIFLLDYLELRILRNRAVDPPDESRKKQPYLLPELSQFDFFIWLRDDSATFIDLNFEVKIKNLPCVDYFQEIDISKLKSKENLIF